MSSWVYCSKCGQGMDAPTPREVLESDYKCPQCGYLEDPRVTVNEVIIGLLERVEFLETHVLGEDFSD